MPGRTEENRGKIRFGAPIIATKAYKDAAVGGRSVLGRRVLGSFEGSLSKTGGRQWVSRSAGGELMHIKTTARSPRPTRLPPRSSERSATLHLISALHPISALDLIGVLIPRFLIRRRAPGHR